jgi:Zn-dependent metalloprotease
MKKQFFIPDYISRKAGDSHSNCELHDLHRSERVSNTMQFSFSFLKRKLLYQEVELYNARNTEGIGNYMNSTLLQAEPQLLYKNTWLVLQFLSEVMRQRGIDDNYYKIKNTIHFGKGYNNAFWNGEQMVFGDGDGVLFKSFMRDIDVLAHEMGHGITQFGCQLRYEGQAGAINEHLSDVFASMVKQYVNNQTVEQADWLIGDNVFVYDPAEKFALRNMRDPGTAFTDHPILGNDPQPNHFDYFIETDADDGGVHLNSGILNRAYYEVCSLFGGFAYEKVGKLWFAFMLDRNMNKKMDFEEFRAILLKKATRFGFSFPERNLIEEGFRIVGIH